MSCQPPSCAPRGRQSPCPARRPTLARTTALPRRAVPPAPTPVCCCLRQRVVGSPSTPKHCIRWTQVAWLHRGACPPLWPAQTAAPVLPLDLQEADGSRRLVAFNAAEVGQDNRINLFEYDEGMALLHRWAGRLSTLGRPRPPSWTTRLPWAARRVCPHLPAAAPLHPGPASMPVLHPAPPLSGLHPGVTLFTPPPYPHPTQDRGGAAGRCLWLLPRLPGHPQLLHLPRVTQ